MVRPAVHSGRSLALAAGIALALAAAAPPAPGQSAGPERYATLPAASPDGRRIAVQAGAYSRERPEISTADIWVIEVATGRATCVTRRERPWLDETPSFLPDGRIVFQSTRAGRFDVWIMRADGTRPRRVTP